jgi:hypothetical protein
MSSMKRVFWLGEMNFSAGGAVRRASFGRKMLRCGEDLRAQPEDKE